MCAWEIMISEVPYERNIMITKGTYSKYSLTRIWMVWMSEVTYEQNILFSEWSIMTARLTCELNTMISKYYCHLPFASQMPTAASTGPGWRQEPGAQSSSHTSVSDRNPTPWEHLQLPMSDRELTPWEHLWPPMSDRESTPWENLQPPKCTLARNQNCRCSWDLFPGTLTCDLGILTASKHLPNLFQA